MHRKSSMQTNSLQQIAAVTVFWKNRHKILLLHKSEMYLFILPKKSLLRQFASDLKCITKGIIKYEELNSKIFITIHLY